MSRCPEPFRRKVFDLLADGMPVKHVAEDLGISQQTIYNWRRQSLIDRGELPGMTSTEHVELGCRPTRGCESTCTQSAEASSLIVPGVSRSFRTPNLPTRTARSTSKLLRSVHNF